MGVNKPLIVSLEALKDACTSKKAWVAIDGMVYDVTELIPKHPGGQDFLLTSAGKDISKAFDTYHGVKVRQILPKYFIGNLSGQDVPSYPPPSEFWLTLKKRVDDYFWSSKIDPKYSPTAYTRYLLTVIAILGLYWLQWSNLCSNIWIFCVMSAAHALALSQYGFTAVHDGSHASVGHSPTLWKILISGNDFFLGFSGTLWIYRHILSHHIFTNVEGFDPDIETVEFRRIKESQRYRSFYKLQPIYAPILYGLLATSTRIYDIMEYFAGRGGHVKINPFTLEQNLVFWGGKIFFHVSRILLPLIWGNAPSRVIGAFLLSEFVLSMVLGIIFEANHVVNTAAFPRVNPKTGQMEIDWALLQVETAQDYSHDKPWITFFSGSLNYQVVHHLFPAIAQEHLPAVARIVRQTTTEYGIKYEVKDSLWSAIGGHIGLLRLMAKPPTQL